MCLGSVLCSLRINLCFCLRIFFLSVFAAYKQVSLFFILYSFFRLEAVQLIFVVVGACMGALGLMILFVGCLATGATRHKIYRAWSARVGGRISCAVVCSDFVLYT